MAVVKHDGTETFVGAVLDVWSHFYYDGMEQEYAEVWNIQTHERQTVSAGYYGGDGYNLAGTIAVVDVTAETVKDMVNTYRAKAWKAFENSVNDFKKEIRAGITAEVVRGRKVKKGTILNVFWVGLKPNYMGEKELLAGCHDADGKKVWVKAEYLKCLTKVKSPNAKERKRFFKDYMKNAIGERLLEAYAESKRRGQ